MHDENMRKYLKNKTHYYSGMPWCCTHLRYLALKTLTEGECCTWTGKLFQIDTPEYRKERLYNSDLGLGEYNCKGHVDLSVYLLWCCYLLLLGYMIVLLLKTD